MIILNFFHCLPLMSNMIDSGIERKLIEQYVSGRAQHIIYVISSLSFLKLIFDKYVERKMMLTTILIC